MNARLKRFLSLVLAGMLVITMVPGSAVFAEDDLDNGENKSITCSNQADCGAETHNEECPQYRCPECTQNPCVCEKDKEPKVEEVSCTADEDCKATENHAEVCPKAVCTGCSKVMAECICNQPAIVDELQADYALYTKQEKNSDNMITSGFLATIGVETSVYLMWSVGDAPASVTAENVSGTAVSIDVTDINETCKKITFTPQDAVPIKIFLTGTEGDLLKTCVLELISNGPTCIGAADCVEGKHSVECPLFTKEELPLYMDKASSLEIRKDQGRMNAVFTTDEAGTCVVAPTALTTDGVVYFKEINETANSAWLVASGPGTGSVIYETDTAIYVYSVTVKEQLPLYMDKASSLEIREDQGRKNAVFTTDEAGNCVVAPTALTTDGVVYFKEIDETANSAWLAASGPGTGHVIYETDTAVYIYSVTVTQNGNNNGNNGNTQKPPYVQLGPELTGGFGFVDGAIVGMSGGITSFTYFENVDLDVSHYLFLFLNKGQINESMLTNQNPYNMILESATFQLEEWEPDDPNDTYVPELTAFDATVNGVKTKGVRLYGECGHLGRALISASFNINGRTHKVYIQIFYSDPNIAVEVGENVDLNEILASGDALRAYLQQNHRDKFEKYTGEGFIQLMLPAKTYDEVIEVNVTDPSEGQINLIHLVGHEDGTQMKGLVAKSKLFTVRGINFVGDGSGTAIKHVSYNTLGTVLSCTFKNYDCAIEEASYNYTRIITKCVFENCDTAVHMAPKKTGNSFNGHIQILDNQFVNNGTAVYINNLPKGITPFGTRVYNNTFLFNDTDFDLNDLDLGNQNGNMISFYFNGNYFGKNSSNGDSGNQLSNQVRGPADIKVNNSKIKVVTNPVRKTIDATDEYWIYAGTNQHAAIFNSEASGMLIDGDAFEATTNARTTDSGTEMPVSIVDDEGNEIALWTFN